MADDYGMGEPGGSSNEREDTFFLPPDFPGSDKLKQGDTITLKVLSKGENGDIEVEHVGAEAGEPDWKTDLKQHMNKPSEPMAEMGKDME